MKSKFFKRLIPMVLGGVAMLVLAMPMTASAHDWDHHDNGIHNGWVHRDNYHPAWRGHEVYRPAPTVEYPNTYYRPSAPVYSAPAYAAPGYAYAAPGYATSYAAGGCNMTRMQNVYRYDRRTGHPAAANDVARKMRNCGGGSVYGQNVFGNLFR